MRTDALSREDWLVGGLALLLAIVLLFLPWFSFNLGILSITHSYTLTATDAPDGWSGVLAVLACLAIVADLLVERLSPQTTVPNLGGSRTATRFRLAVIAAVFVAIKFVFNIHFSDFGFGFWVAVVLTVALVFVTLRLSQDRPVLNVST